MSEALLEVEKLRKYFSIGGGLLGGGSQVRAVDGVDLEIGRGETVGLVGESGCGKSTLGRLILRLIDADEGTLRFDGLDLRALGRAKLRDTRRHMQIIFQDPYASLNPRMTIGEAVGEGLKVHGIPTSSAEGSVSASGSRGPWPWSRSSSSRTSPSRHSMSRSRPRSSTCWSTFRSALASPISSSPTTCGWCDTCAIASP